MRVEKHAPVTVARIERALLVLAHIIERDGDVYVPIYERLERDLEKLQRTQATMQRAKQRLEQNQHRLVDIGLKTKR